MLLTTLAGGRCWKTDLTPHGIPTVLEITPPLVPRGQSIPNSGLLLGSKEREQRAKGRLHLPATRVNFQAGSQGGDPPASDLVFEGSGCWTPASSRYLVQAGFTSPHQELGWFPLKASGQECPPFRLPELFQNFASHTPCTLFFQLRKMSITFFSPPLPLCSVF